MSLIVGALRAVFGADTAAFTDGVDEVDRRLKKSQRAFETFGRKIGDIGKVMSLTVTAPMVAIGAASVKTAMDMEELESAFDVTFKNSSSSMREWAEETGNILGRSTKEVQDSAVAFASLFNKSLSPEKANELTKQFSVLTQDLASFKNLSNEVAQQKLFSGLTGEAEPLKSVGVFINAAATEAKAFELGLEKVNGKFTDQQKIVARAALIQEQLAEASGDVVRTQGSATNQLKRASAAFEEMRVVIGTKLLPVITPLIEKAASAFEWFGNLSDGMQGTILIVGALVTAIGPMLTVVGTLSTVLAPLGASLAVATGATTGLAGAMTVALGPIGLVVVAIGAATMAYKLFSPALRDNKKARDELYGVVDKNKSILAQEKADTLAGAQAQLAAAKATRANLKAKLDLQEAELKKKVKGFSIASSLPLGLGASLRGKIGKDIAETGRAMSAARTAIEANDAATIELEKNLLSLGGTIDGVASSTTSLTKEQIAAKAAKEKAYKEAAKDAAKRREDHRDLMADSKEEIEINKKLADALKISEREYNIVSEKIDLVKDGFVGTDDAARDLAISLIDSRDAFQAVRDAADANAQALEDALNKQKELEKERQDAAEQAIKDHDDVTKSVQDEIAENEKLIAALKISQREYEITSIMLKLIEDGHNNAGTSARAMAEDLLASRERLADLKGESEKTEKALKKTGETGVEAFDGVLGSFTNLLNGIKSGDFESVIGGILDLLGGISQGSGGGNGGGILGAFKTVGTLFGGASASPIDPAKTSFSAMSANPFKSYGGTSVAGQNMGGIVKVVIEEGALFKPVIQQEAAGVAAPIAEVTTVRGIGQYSDTMRAKQDRRL